MKAFQVLSDNTHTLLTQELFPANRMPAAATLTIDSEPSVAHFYGFGVAISGSSCYNLSLMNEQDRTAFLESVYSKDGMNLSIGRLTVAASDYSAELYSYDDVPFDTELKHFSIDRDRRYILPMIKEILRIRPDLKLFSSPWSPPGWMKTGGSICGGYMREEFIDCYADYYVKFLKAYEEEGIHIFALTPQNEPDTQESGKMPACIWHPETEAKFIRILREKLDKAGLDTKIWMYDHNFVGADRVDWTIQYGGLEDQCSGIAFHYYEGAVSQTAFLREKYPQLELHFTEAGPRLYDNYDLDWCKWATMIARALKLGYQSFTGWNLMLNELGGPNVGPFFCGGLVTRNSVTGELAYSGQYKALRHIAHYVTENAKIYPIRVDQKVEDTIFRYPNLNMLPEGFLVDNGEKGKTVVITNPNKEKVQAQIVIDQKNWYVEMMPNTVNTLVFEA